MRIKGATLVLTDKCTAECGICCAGCSGRNKRVMSERVLSDALEMIKELVRADGGDAMTVSFSGGEPFLFYDLLKRGAAKAKELGFSVDVCTNGFWGAWPRDEINAKLTSLGLDCITISADYFHGKFIPEPAIEGAMRYVKGSALKCTLMIGETRDAPADTFIVKMGLYKFMTNIKIHPYMMIGRAKSMDEKNFFRLREPGEIKCPAAGSLTIRYDGEVFLCGGPAWTEDSTSFGNIRDSSLSDILSSERAKKFSAVLSQKGVFGKASRITGCSEDVGLPYASGKCSGACELCLDIFSDERKLAVFNALDLLSEESA